MPVSPGGTTYNDDELDSLFKAVGFVVIQWGQAEQSLDIIIAAVYQRIDDKKLMKRMPKMLAPKLEYLSKCLSHIPALAQFQSEGETLISNFRKLSDKRHDLVHGAIGSLSVQDGAFMFTKIDIENDSHVVREFRFDAADFPALTKDLIDLGAQTTSLAKRVWEIQLVTK